MKSIPENWGTAYAKQALADFELWDRLQGDPDIPTCQKLHYLQMACEKLCKAFLCKLQHLRTIAGVRGGVLGTMPNLTELVTGEPKLTTDFRQVYAGVLEDWLGLAAREVLGGKFTQPPLFRD